MRLGGNQAWSRFSHKTSNWPQLYQMSHTYRHTQTTFSTDEEGVSEHHLIRPSSCEHPLTQDAHLHIKHPKA